MSKEPRLTRTGYRGRSLHKFGLTRSLSPAASASGLSSVPAKRVCLGGRGREWAAESLKVLERMQELEDARPFLEPMDPIKYPEYYSLCSEPIDLSKIMLKFHGGAYSSLHAFNEDVRLMFDNHKLFYSDPNTETYKQVRRLAEWFNMESTLIRNKWYRISEGSNPIRSYTYVPRHNSLEARIQQIEAENTRILRGSLLPPDSTDQQIKRPILPILPMPTTSSGVKISNSDLVQIKVSASSSFISSSGSSSTPLYAFRLASNPMNGQLSLVSSESGGNSVRQQIQHIQQISRTKPIVLVPKSKESVNLNHHSQTSAASSLMYMCPSETSVATPHVSSKPTAANLNGESSEKKMTLKIEVTNVWFGAVRIRPTQPISFTEDGFSMTLKGEDMDSSEVEFVISANEIVRCAAYFGNIRKHTFFIFVLPNCTRRLQSMGDEIANASLIVMFLPALSQPQMAKLVYLFWQISKQGIFGELFCEIDQKAALALLSNIKPTIMSNVNEKLKYIRSKRLAVQQRNSDLNSSLAASENHLHMQTGESIFSSPGNDGIHSDDVEVYCKQEPVDEEFSDDSKPELEADLSALSQDVSGYHVNDFNDESLSEETETVSENHGSLKMTTARDVIHKHLKVRYKPGILKRRSPPTNSENKQAKSNKIENPDVEKDDQFTIVQWYPGDDEGGDDNRVNEDKTMGRFDCSPSNKSLSNDRDENDLEIVAPCGSDDEMDVGVNTEIDILPNEFEEDRDDLVLTSEKINIRCPITQQIMKNPMKNLICGHSYDKHGIEDLIEHRGKKARCPVTGCSNTTRLVMSDVEADVSLQRYIELKTSQTDSQK